MEIKSESVIAEIKSRLRLLQGVYLFTVTVFFAIIVIYLFKQYSEFLSFIPDISISFIIAIAFLLVLIGIYILSTISKRTVISISEYSNKLDSILKITKDIREEIYSDILLKKIMDYSLSLTNSDAGSILLVDGDNLVFKTVLGEKATLLGGKSIPLKKGIAALVAKNGLPFVSADAQKDENFDPEVDRLTGFETKSVLCVPLKSKSGVIGVIELLNKKENFYGQADIDLISYFADHAAASITTTQFYEDQKNFEIHLTDMLLEAIDFQIPEKMGHSRRVSKYSNLIARALNMPEDKRKRLYIASLLHDVGFLKIRINTQFRPEEFRKHPVIGYEMIKPVSFYADLAPFILYHHERFDGNGYPEGLKGNEIPLASRIIAITEAFDAMVSSTSYKAAISFENALLEIKLNAGTQFDPDLVNVFLENIEVGLIK